MNVYIALSAVLITLTFIRSLTLMRGGGFFLAYIISSLAAAPVLTSTLLHHPTFADASVPMLFVAWAGSAACLGSRCSAAEIKGALKWSAISAISCFCVAIVVYHWDIPASISRGARLDTGFQPNYLGLLTLSLYLAAILSFRWHWQLLALVFSLIVADAASARGTMITILALFVANRALSLPGMNRRDRAIFFGLAAVSVIAALVYSGPLINLVSEAFKVNDQHRGVNSGASGRADVWAYFLQRWNENLLFGPGRDTRLLVEGKYLYSHNMILQSLTDGGIFGLTGLLITFLVGILAAVRVRGENPLLARFVSLSIVAYLTFGIFEGRALNVGNPLSLLVFFSIYAAIGRVSRLKLWSTDRRIDWRMRPTRIRGGRPTAGAERLRNESG